MTPDGIVWLDDDGTPLYDYGPGLNSLPGRGLAREVDLLQRLPAAELAGFEGPGVVESHRNREGAKPDTLFIPGERIYFERSFAVAALAAGDPVFALHNPQDSGRRLGLVSLEVTLSTAVPTRLGVIYASQRGVPTTTMQGLNVDSPGASGATPSSTALIETAWATLPTLNTNYVKQQVSSIVGETMLWSWFESLERPLIIPNGGSMVLRESAGAVTGDMLVNLRWVEMEVQR
jgi:hypothetical protein